ncbi:pentatricopeptide repeat-containing protein-like protein, chloroplastic [Salvia divinorum]|uniref:Pentatricopeptide repeat-containing protein-like protein, chloroplastic n=1 Tax=Salvia divinorum TaxID=28513 RepID=A0ABD1GGX6_SALDI
MTYRKTTSFVLRYPEYAKPHNENPYWFVQCLCSKNDCLNESPRNNQFSLKKSHHNSLLNSSASFTADPNSYLTQLCTQNELNQAVNVLSSVGRELRTDIEEETFVSLVRLCEYKRASNEGFIDELILVRQLLNKSLGWITGALDILHSAM